MGTLLQLCSYAALLAGRWLVGPYETPSAGLGVSRSPWSTCPHALDSIMLPDPHPGIDTWFAMQTASMQDQVSKYACGDRPRRSTTFHTGGCSLLPTAKALHAMRSDHRRRNTSGASLGIYYVGDSLVGQLYLSALCMFEEVGGPHPPTAAYHGSYYLRGDFPCAEQCRSNATYRNDSFVQWFNPCGGCPDGNAVPFNRWMSERLSWYRNIPFNTAAIVLGSGAWYNLHKGIANSGEAYQDMLLYLAPYLQALVRRRLRVFWVGLPPSDSVYHAVDKYEWEYFRGKDELADKILSPVGVQFINLTALVEERKDLDPSIRSDHLHWW